MNPLFKSPLEQILSGSHSTRQIEESKKSSYNQAIDDAIKATNSIYEKRLPDGDDALAATITKLQSLKK